MCQLESIMKTFITIVALTLASLVSFSSLATSVSFPDSLTVTGMNGDTKFAPHEIQLAEGKNLIELSISTFSKSMPMTPAPG